ncbi:8775_t:CDS:2, partial [Paraglomus occultum]
MELKAIIEEAITKISKENEVEIVSSIDLAQEIQNIHICQQIPIGIIIENLINLEPLKRKLLPNIYHRIVKKIHKHIWKPSRRNPQQPTTSTRGLPTILAKNRLR